MKSPLKLTLTSTAFAFSLSGCMSLSTYQTADTVKDGEVEYGLGVSQFIISGSDDSSDSGEWESIPTPEASLRFGINEKTDVGLKIYPFSAIMDVKHQLLKTEAYSNAFGIGASWMHVDGDNVTDIYASYYHTIYHSDRLSSTLAPKLIYRLGDFTPDGELVLPGVTYTLEYKLEDSTVSIMPEVGIYEANGEFLGHVGLGLRF